MDRRVAARRRYILRSRTEATAAMEPTRFVAALSKEMKANMGKVSKLTEVELTKDEKCY